MSVCGETCCSKRCLPGANDRLCAIGRTELTENAVDMVADGFLAKREGFRDLSVVKPARNQIKHFALACSQFQKLVAGTLCGPILTDESPHLVMRCISMNQPYCSGLLSGISNAV